LLKKENFMAVMQASAQFDINNVAELLDPLTRTQISDGGYHVSDPQGAYVDLFGPNLRVGADGDMTGTLTDWFQYLPGGQPYASLTNMYREMGVDYWENGYTVDGQTVYHGTAEFAYSLAGNDVVNGSVYSDVLAGFAGNDTVSGNNGNDQLYGWSGDDFLDGGAGFDTLVGAEGNDELLGGLNGDVLYGGLGNDLLRGGNGLDSLNGGEGNDVLLGALGTDTLTGGAGNDVFRFTSALDGRINIDTITDYQVGVDQIQLSSSIFTVFANRVGQTVGLNQYLTYNQSTGALSYDADGSGGNPALEFAIIGTSSHPSLAADQFLIV
jgi:Ca2+-binding RTX toxin-like protein